MMKMTISRSNRLAIAMAGALVAPAFASAQTTATASPTAQLRAAGPTIRPGEFYAAPYVERDGGPPNAGNIVGTGDVPGIPLTEQDRPLQSYERVFVTLPPGMPNTVGTRYVAVRPGPCAIAEAEHYIATIGIGPDDVIVAAPPMSHAYG